MKIQLQYMSTRLPHLAEPLYGPRSALRWNWIWFVAILLVCVVYVGLALSPSSYALGLEKLGQPVSGTWFGTPRGIRSDEWMVYTPYMQIAVENNFSQTNTLSPYHENLRSFQALPLLDWALAFKPYHWGFFVAPPAYGYSFYFFFMSLAFLAGWALFTNRLGLSVWIAVPLAVSLYFSQYVQVWWTTNAGAFSLAPWVALAWMYSGHRLLRIGLTAYAITVWMLSCAYPPFLYAIALAVGVLIIAFKRETISLRSLYDATVAGSIAIGFFIGYFHDLIDIMQQTVYPGRRVAVSGGVGLERLLAQLNPVALIHKFEPLGRIKGSNACEIAVLSTLLPLYAFALGDHRSFKARLAQHRATLLTIAVGLSIYMVWMFLSVHPLLARISGLYLMPPPRALVGFGLLLNITAAAYLAIAGLRVSALRIIATVMLVCLMSWAKLTWSDAPLKDTFSILDAVPILATAALLAGLVLLRSAPARIVLTMWAAAMANIAMFGTFNPVQSAHPIFNIDKSAVHSELMAGGARTDKNGVIVAHGHYGALIPGAGLSSINHVLYTPQIEFFRRYFPHIDEARFNEIFNRYAHIVVNDASEPSLLSPDSLSLPFNAMVQSGPSTQEPTPELTHLVERPEIPSDVAFGHVDAITLSQSGKLRIVGWSRTPLDSQAELGLWSNVRLNDVKVVRIHRADVAAQVAANLADSGFSIEATVAEADDSSELCLAVLRDHVIETTLVFPGERRNCAPLNALAD